MIPTESLEHQLLPIEFVIVGGGVAGLCSAVSLTRVGHKVTLLEQKDDFGETPGASGVTIPPNVTKFLMRWGMHDKGKALPLHIQTAYFARFESGYMLGKHMYDAEVMDESGGVYVSIDYGALRKMLHDQALENGATIRTSCRVTSYNVGGVDRPSIILESGEIIEADVIIGADGLRSLARTTIVGQEERDTPLGIVLYNAIIPGEKIRADPELADFVNNENAVWNWLGNGRAIVAFPTRIPHSQDSEARNLTMLTWLPNNDVTEGGWTNFVDSRKFVEALGICDPRVHKLATLASQVACIPLTERPLLKDWAHGDGRLAVIGDAAHPFYPGSLQGLGMGACDSATLGHLFQHLHHRKQIESFLFAYNEIRQARVDCIRRSELDYLETTTMPEGDEQQERDMNMRARYDAGLNALDEKNAAISQQWEHAQEIFTYDAEDEADDWWVQWGSLQEKATFNVIKPDFSIQINEEASAADSTWIR